MDITEILKDKGIDEKTIKAILDDMKTNRIFTAAEENLDVRYSKLKADHDGQTKQLGEANTLIEELKKGTAGQEAMQQKITAYETQVAQLQAEVQQIKVDAAVKVALLSEKVADVDYIAYKLNEKLKKDGETLTLDESGSIKGWTDKLAGLKTQFPTMFTATEGDGSGYKVLNPNRLEQGDDGDLHPTKETFARMGYEERVKLKKQNEELYKQLAH